MKKYLLISLIVTSALALLSMPVFAKERTITKCFFKKITTVNLEAVLGEIAEETGVKIEFQKSEGLPTEIEDTILFSYPAEKALATVLAGTGYWFTETAEGCYLVAPKEEIIKEILKAEEIKAIKAKIAKLKKVKAEEIAKSETEMKEIRTRSALKVEPGKLSEEEKVLPQRRFALYAVGLDPEYAHVNSGGRFELSLLPSDLRILAEGVELEKEKPAVVFISLMLIPWHRAISPYIGVGGEISQGTETAPGKKSKRCQVFAGTELGENFFLEVKYIDEGRINLKTADVYSAIGFKISF